MAYHVYSKNCRCKKFAVYEYSDDKSSVHAMKLMYGTNFVRYTPRMRGVTDYGILVLKKGKTLRYNRY